VCPCPQVGDGTTSVVVFAGELLREAKPFVEEMVPPQVIIRGTTGLAGGPRAAGTGRWRALTETALARCGCTVGGAAPRRAAYRKAALLAVQRVREIAVPIDRNDPVRFRDVLEKCAATAMNSKLISHYQYARAFFFLFFALAPDKRDSAHVLRL